MHKKRTDAVRKSDIRLESGDFYFDNGFMVFTEQYLTRRGYCCGNGCRHCPYKKKSDS